MARPHIKPVTLDELSWTPATAKGSVHKLIARVRAQAQLAIDWYVQAIKVKRVGATITRFGTILATTLAALFTAGIPVATTGSFGDFTHPATLAAGAAAIAGALQGFDRFFGFSRAWMRYISTELKIRTALSAFNISWPARISKWANGTPNPEQVQESIAACEALITEVDDAIRQETDQWIADFQASLKNLQEATKAVAEAEAARARQREADKKAREDAERPGSLNVTVTNGTDFPNGWQIQVPGRGTQTVTGNTVALDDLGPGIVNIVVEGVDKNGDKKQGQNSKKIPAGDVTECSVTLA